MTQMVSKVPGLFPSYRCNRVTVLGHNKHFLELMENISQSLRNKGNSIRILKLSQLESWCCIFPLAFYNKFSLPFFLIFFSSSLPLVWWSECQGRLGMKVGNSWEVLSPGWCWNQVERGYVTLGKYKNIRG